MGDITTYPELSGTTGKHISGTQKVFRFAPAFVVFVLICQLITRSNLVNIDPLASSRRTWTTWALDSFVHESKAPDVVFLGSSLMLTPLNMADAQALRTKFDGALHHESDWFSALVKYSTGCNLSTFDFALPGEMPSDAYLIEKHLFKAEKKPKMVVYGVGPRDFMDNLLDSPCATDPYHWLAKLDPHASEWEFCGTSWYQKLNCAVSNAFMPNQVRLQLAEDLSARWASFVNFCLPQAQGAVALSAKERHWLMPNYHAMDVAVGECIFEPRIDMQAGRFVNNLDEYRERYAHPDWNKFQTQLSFLDKLLNLAKQRQIQFVLVAMPITSINRELISGEAWRAYKNGLSVTARSNQASFIDLSESDRFTDFDFGDTVHLNALGGLKMVQELAGRIVADPRLSEALGLKHNKSKFANKGMAVL